MIDIKKIEHPNQDIKTEIFSIEVNGYIIKGTNTSNHLWCFRENVYEFNSDQSFDSKQDFDLFQVIKDVYIELLPNRSKYDFYQYLNDEVNYPINILPYPLNTFSFTKLDDKYIVGMSCYLEIETWKRKWAATIYFNELEKTIKSFPEFTVLKTPDTTVYDEMFEFHIEIEVSQIETISDSLEKALPKFEQLINLVERNLSDVAGILKIIDRWNVNQNNDNEEFWQNFFENNSHIISQAFSAPSFIFKDKAYLGGKGLDNKGGKLVDFVYKNNKTNNILLIEIKTPVTKIIGSNYRGTFSISAELSGAVNQMLQYKDQQQKEFYTICGKSNDKYELFNPKCLMIIGSLTSLLPEERHAFELFRNDLKSIDILTFDELFGKIEIVLELIKANTN